MDRVRPHRELLARLLAAAGTGDEGSVLEATKAALAARGERLEAEDVQPWGPDGGLVWSAGTMTERLGSVLAARLHVAVVELVGALRCGERDRAERALRHGRRTDRAASAVLAAVRSFDEEAVGAALAELRAVTAEEAEL